MRAFFMASERIGFSRWEIGDGALAASLWGDPAVARFICASGAFTPREVQSRLAAELENDKRYHVQYWPMFMLDGFGFIGCCGLRPYEADAPRILELGFHLKPEYWGKGLALEAAQAVIRHAACALQAKELRAGHHPQNAASKKLLEKLGFEYMAGVFYAPTGLCHPTYRLPLSGGEHAPKAPK